MAKLKLLRFVGVDKERFHVHKFTYTVGILNLDMSGFQRLTFVRFLQKEKVMFWYDDLG